MANNKSTYTLEIDANIKNLMKSLGEVEGSLSGFLSGANAPKGLEKAFEKVKNLLGQIADKTSKPLDVKGFKGLSGDLDKVSEGLHSITRLVGDFADLADDVKIQFLPDDEKRKIEEATRSMEKYLALVTAASTKAGELDKARKTQSSAESRVKKAEGSVSTITGKKEIKEAKLTSARIELEAQEGLDKRNPKKIRELDAEIRELDASIRSLEGELKLANDELELARTAYDSASDSVKRLSGDIKGIETKQLNELRETAQGLGIDWEAFKGKKHATQIELLTKAIEEQETIIKNKAEPAYNNLVENISNLGKENEDIKKKVENTTEALKEQDEAVAQQKAFEAKIKSFLGLSGAAQVLRSALRDAMQTITELDATMTEMAVVTDLTVGDYWDQLPEYSKQASELGVSINSAYKAATLYYQQGLKGNEVTKISAETLKMASVAGLSAEDATNKMTAALRGFNMEINEASAQKIADVYSELAAITAADVDEISTAMTKTASIASSAGMEFETTAAFLSQIIETTRESAETAGTAMKTVIARFQELKKSPDEIGEIDGEIVDANAIETALRSVGVSLRDAGGQFRDLDDVFLELSSKWDGLDKNTQRYIATIAAGSRQQSRFIAMMSDYNRTQELTTAANNSAGASNRQFEKTLDSLEAKMERLKNAWHEFTMGILNSDLVKFGVDILTKFLEVINKVTEGLGDKGLAGGLTKIVGIIAIFKTSSKIFEKLKQPIIAMFAEVVKQAGLAGEQSMREYKKNAEKAAQEDQPEGQPDNADQTPQQQGGVVSKFGDGKLGKASTLGMKLIGGDHFIEASEAHKEVKKAKIVLGKDKKGQQQAKEKYTSNKKRLDELKKENELTSEQQQELEDLTKSTKEYEDAAESLGKNSEKQFKALSSGLNTASTALMGVGMAFGMAGQALEEAGFGKAAEVFNTMGQVASTASAALGIIPPILSLIQTLFPGVGAASAAAGGTAAAAGTAASAAWSIVGVIVLIVIAAIVVAMVAIIAIMAAVKNASIEERMKKAAQATEDARKAAEEAKEAYNELLSDRSEYDKLQSNLENLTYGTREWKQALVEANQQVLELLQTYPQLTKYLTRGEDGQLAISDEGWDAMLEQQQLKIKNSQALVLARQLDEQDLKNEKLREQFDKKSVVVRQEGDTAYVDSAATKGLQQDLMDLYLVQNDSMAENVELAEQLAKKYSITTEQVWNSAKALEANKAEIEAIALETENIARANLTAMASDRVLDSDMGEQTIDAFAGSLTGEYFQEQVDKETQKLYNEAESGNQLDQGETFKQLASEYNVTTTGNDRVDLENLYEAMGGNKEVSADLSDEDLRKAVAEMSATKEVTQKMDDYTARLENLSSADQMDIAGLFSQSGMGMSMEFAESLFTTDENGTQTFNQEALNEQARSLGYENIQQWAEALNMTTDEFYDKAEKNARTSLVARSKAFEKLEKSLGKTEGSIKKIGETTKLSAGAQEAISNKIIDAAGISGDEAASDLLNTLGVALDSVEGDAESFAQQLTALDWQDSASWEKLPDIMKQLGITMTDEVKTFIEQATDVSGAISKINFETFNDQINRTIDLIEKAREGARKYSEEDYKSFVSANKNLEGDFLQIGDEFIYLGNAMDDLVEALQKNTIAKLEETNFLMAAQSGMAEILEQRDDIKSNASVNEQRQWLIQSVSAFAAQGYDVKNLGIAGLGLDTDFSELDDSKVKEMVSKLLDYRNRATDLKDQQANSMRNANVAAYTLNDTAFNARMGYAGGEWADEHRDALRAQGVEAGVGEVMLQSYANASKQYEEMMKQYEGMTFEQAEAAMSDSDKVILDNFKLVSQNMVDMIHAVEENEEAQEELDALSPLAEKVAAAIEEQRQQTIDKLSEVNDSINSANSLLISKIQEQIDADRQERENQAMKNNLTDMYSQQAYLGMDTSGVNALEMANNEKAIEQAEQEYRDTMIDQAIQRLQDANEQAAQQRERQINLLQQQLDYEMQTGQIADEAARIVRESIDQVAAGQDVSQTELNNYMQHSLKTLGGMDKANAKTEWETIIQTAIQNKKTDTQTNESGTSVTGNTLGNSGGASSGTGGVDEEHTQRLAREEAIVSAKNILKANNITGRPQAANNEQIKQQLQAYVETGKGTQTDFWNSLSEDLFEFAENEGAIGATTAGFDDAEDAWFDLTLWGGEGQDTSKEDIHVETGSRASDQQALTDLWNATKTDVMSQGGYNTVVKGSGSDAKLYIRKNGGTWYEVLDQGADLKSNWDNRPAGLIGYAQQFRQNEYKKYKTGGLADFTGPAWLDGTKSRPEYVLSADQTERFFSLVDVLEGYDKEANSSKTYGDNYFDIEINVEKLENDYDVEKVADKIRRMIYDDATYRNVNAINHNR